MLKPLCEVTIDEGDISIAKGLAMASYCNFAYSALASFRMGMSGSASFQSLPCKIALTMTSRGTNPSRRFALWPFDGRLDDAELLSRKEKVQSSDFNLS